MNELMKNLFRCKSFILAGSSLSDWYSKGPCITELKRIFQTVGANIIHEVFSIQFTGQYSYCLTLSFPLGRPVECTAQTLSYCVALEQTFETRGCLSLSSVTG